MTTLDIIEKTEALAEEITEICGSQSGALRALHMLTLFVAELAERVKQLEETTERHGTKQ